MNKIISLLISVAFLASCKKSNDQVQLSSEKNVSVVKFRSIDNPSLPDDVTAIVSTDSIRVQMLQNISVNSLVPSISFTGRSISPANNTTQNFNTPITYTITAEDGTTKNYTFKITRVDSATLITGRWHIVKDSLFDTPNFVNSGGGHPTPGVYIGTAADFWEFYANGSSDYHENNNGYSGIHYQVLPNNKLSVDGLDIYYDPATIETFTSNTAIFSWAKTLSNGERYFRRMYLSR
jgi:hypothetical protein